MKEQYLSISFAEAADMFRENLGEIIEACAERIKDEIDEFDKWSKELRDLTKTQLEREIAEDIITIRFNDQFDDQLRHLAYLKRRNDIELARHPVRQRITQDMIIRARSVPVESLYHGKLSQRGKQLWGRCPFHKEKTASFVIYTNDNHWYCYGCKVGDDVISYHMMETGKTFSLAVRALVAGSNSTYE